MSAPTIPPRMLAARFHGNGDVRVEEVENPALREGEVRIKVAFAGGSDSTFEFIKLGDADLCSGGQVSAGLTCMRSVHLAFLTSGLAVAAAALAAARVLRRALPFFTLAPRMRLVLTLFPFSSCCPQFYDGPATCRAPGCPHPLTGETRESAPCS